MLKETSVYAILVAALRTLDTYLRMFMAFAYVGYGFCVRCLVFTYVGYGYGFGIHVVGLDRAILYRQSNITVNYALW